MNDAMQDAGLGVETDDTERKMASDFAELQGEQQRKVDGWVNWGFTLLIVVFAAVVVFA